MNTRITTTTSTKSVLLGLEGWLEETRVKLPLKAVECEFEVCGDLLGIEICQVYHQNNAKPLDCLYTFPLPATAAVHLCEMHVNGRLIRAKVEEKERARKLAREKKEAGFRTSLVEMERDNIFTLSLGNLQPEDVVVIRFGYFQTLTRLVDWTSFTVPFCPGVRYIPGEPLLRAPLGRGTADDTDQVPDASRISPPRISAFHPDAARVSIRGTVEHPLNDVVDISSPTHPVLVRSGDSKSTVEMAEAGAVPDCDFTLRWTEQPTSEASPTGWVTSSGTDRYAMVRLRAPEDVAPSDGEPGHYYFLVDRSGSMEGMKWEKAVESFREFLKVLGPDDTVSASFFDSTVSDFAEKPMTVSRVLSDPALARLESVFTGRGTDLAPALEHVLAKIHAADASRHTSLVLITDGEVANEPAVLDLLRKHQDVRVHAFGIDTTLNDGFLRKLAANNGGSACLMAPTDDIVGAVKRLGMRLRRPVLTDITVQKGWRTARPRIPDLHAGEVFSLSLKGVKPGRKIDVSGTVTGGLVKTYTFELQETSQPALRLLWQKEAIGELVAAGKNKQAIKLSREANLVCELTAFIAWDEAEKVAVSGPDQEIYQAVMEDRLCSSSFRGLASPRVTYERICVPIGGPAIEPELEIGPMVEELRRDALLKGANGYRFTEVILEEVGKAQGRDQKEWLYRVNELLEMLTLMRTEPVADRVAVIRNWVESLSDVSNLSGACVLHGILNEIEKEQAGQPGVV